MVQGNKGCRTKRIMKTLIVSLGIALALSAQQKTPATAESKPPTTAPAEQPQPIQITSEENASLVEIEDIENQIVVRKLTLEAEIIKRHKAYGFALRKSGLASFILAPIPDTPPTPTQAPVTPPAPKK